MTLRALPTAWSRESAPLLLHAEVDRLWKERELVRLALHRLPKYARRAADRRRILTMRYEKLTNRLLAAELALERAR